MASDLADSVADVVEWRVQTIKVAASVRNAWSKNARPVVLETLESDICEIYRKLFLCNVVPMAAETAISAFCQSAFDLALAVRACRPEYLWRQRIKPTRIDKPDVEFIDKYNSPSNYRFNRSPEPNPVKVLFGPVYKAVDGNKILLRPGTELRS